MQSVVELLGWPEIIGVLIIIVVMFGAKYIPELLGGMGRGAEDNGQDRPRYGFKFWLIVALGVAAIYAAAVALRGLLQ